MPSERSARASPPWEEFFATREGTSRSMHEQTSSHTSSWQVRQEGGLSSPWSSDRFNDISPSSSNILASERDSIAGQRFFSDASLHSPSTQPGYNDSPSWTSSIAHLLNSSADSGQPTVSGFLPTTMEYQPPRVEWGSTGAGEERNESPPTARELVFDTSYTSQPSAQDSIFASTAASGAHTRTSAHRTSTTHAESASFCSLYDRKGEASARTAPEAPGSHHAMMDPSPLDANDQYLHCQGGSASERQPSLAQWSDAARMSGSSEIVTFQPVPPAAPCDPPLEVEAFGELAAYQPGDKPQAAACEVNARNESIRSIESRIEELAAGESFDGDNTSKDYRLAGVTGHQLEAWRDSAADSVQRLASVVERLQVTPEVQSWLQQMPASVRAAQAAGNLGAESPPELSPPPSPIREPLPSVKDASARSSETGGSSVGKSPLETLNSLFSTPVKGEQSSLEEELGATLKAWTTSNKKGGSRHRQEADMSFESLNTTGNSAASLAALQQAVKNGRQSKATAAASKWAASVVKAPPQPSGSKSEWKSRANVAGPGLSDAKQTPPATVAWQPAPKRHGAVTPPRYNLDRAAADAMTDVDNWGDDVDQEYFVAQLAKHIARQLHMRVSQTPPKPASNAGSVEPPGAPDSAAWRHQLQSRLPFYTMQPGPHEEASIDVVVDLKNPKPTKKTKKGKTGRRTTRSKTATPKKLPKTKGVGDSDSKYAMTCSPCKRETFTRWVFGRDLVAYKAVAAAVTPAGDTIYVSLYDGTTCYRIGEEKLDSARGWFVYLDAEDAAEQPIPSKCKSVVDRFPRLILKVLVSGRGYQQGNSYSFPVMRPVAVLYPDDVVGKYCHSVPDFNDALQNANKGNVLKMLRQLASSGS